MAFFATLLAAAPASATPTYTRLALSGDYINHYNNPAYGRARADMWVDERLNTINLAADDIRATTRMVKIYNVTRVQVDTMRLETEDGQILARDTGVVNSFGMPTATSVTQWVAAHPGPCTGTQKPLRVRSRALVSIRWRTEPSGARPSSEPSPERHGASTGPRSDPNRRVTASPGRADDDRCPPHPARSCPKTGSPGREGTYRLCCVSGEPGKRRLRWVYSSDGQRELAECCRRAERRWDVGGEFVVAAAEALHERVAGGDSCRRAEAAPALADRRAGGDRRAGLARWVSSG